jgi:hypothetical protein
MNVRYRVELCSMTILPKPMQSGGRPSIAPERLLPVVSAPSILDDPVSTVADRAARLQPSL